MALLIHDPRDIEKPPKRAPVTESYWQRGCEDAKAGRPETLPTNRGGFDRRNIGYANGYAYGRRAGTAVDAEKTGESAASSAMGDDGTIPVHLTPNEIDCLMVNLSDHDGNDFEAECPSCTAYKKLAATSPSDKL